MMRKMILSLFGLAMIVSTLGCNTVQGIGKDIKKGGEAIEKSTH